MDFSSFLTSLGTSFVIFLVLMCLFTWLSRQPGNNVIYYPSRMLMGLDPYESIRVTRNPFDWIREAFSSTESDVIRISGVDSAVYFVFLTTVLGIFVLGGIVLLPVLLPVAATAHGALKANDTISKGSFNDLDKLAMGHIPANIPSSYIFSLPPCEKCYFSRGFMLYNVLCILAHFDSFSCGLQDRSPRLWAFLAATYWISFVAYCLLWMAYRHVSDMRATALMSAEVKSEQFAVLVRDIPPAPQGKTRKEQVDSYFKTIYPETFYRSMVVTDNKKVNKIYEELEGYRKKLARAEVIHAESKQKGNPEGTRPTIKTGFLGLFGKKVDALEYYDEKIQVLIPKLEAEQKVTLKDKQLRSALIFFNDRKTAAAASQSLHATMVDTWTVLDAPEPRQLIWTNLPKNFYGRQLRQYLIYFLVFFTIFFYMIPIGFVSALTTLANLRKVLPFLKVIVDQPALKTVLEAYLPQLALIIFLALLPKFLLFLSKAEGIPSESHAQRAASGKYFYFSVLNVFIGVTISSTLFTELKAIEKKPRSIIDILANNLPRSATFFLTFVALKFFVGYGLELSRIVPLIIFHLKRKYLCKTEAEVREAWAPGDLGYATRVPGDLLIATIVLCYSVIAPIIIPFGVVYFGLAWLIFRNQVLKVYVPSYESYGRMWPHIHTRIVAALFLYQLTMFGYFGTKKFYYAPLIIPLMILSLIFAYVCGKKYYRFFQSPALKVASHELKESLDMELVFRSFIPASLSSDKADEDQFEDALSQVSRSGSTI